MSGRFDGRVAIVTGAGRGIGRAVAERLGQEGARVVLVDRDKERGTATETSLRDSGLDAVFLPADVADTAQIEATVTQVVAELGRVDVLVNNAALVRGSDFFSATAAELDEIYAVNVRGSVMFGQAVAREMVQAGRGGSIVNMSSITAAQGSPGLLHYSASKGAISAMTRSMAVALAEHGIRVNAVAPGTVTTEVVAEIHGRDPELRRQVLARTPLRRLGAPAEIAAVVAFLASDDASYMTGQVLYPDGGRLALSYTVSVDDDQGVAVP